MLPIRHAVTGALRMCPGFGRWVFRWTGGLTWRVEVLDRHAAAQGVPSVWRELPVASIGHAG